MTPTLGTFSHEALLYDGAAAFLQSTATFVDEGVTAGEPVMVMASGPKIDRMRTFLGATADAVHFADMDEIGRNPSRIIPAWRAFVTDHQVRGRPMRGIGEPVTAARSPAALVECQLHESLLNLAFAGAGAFRLLCPYDVTGLRPDVIAEAHRSHPEIHRTGRRGVTARVSSSLAYCGPAARPCDDALPEPEVDPEEFVVRPGELRATSVFVLRHASAAGLRRERVADAVLAVSELAANSIEHGGGHGLVRAWEDGDRTGDYVVYEVSDRGWIKDALAGRRDPGHASSRRGGRGLWLVNQLCDLVQLRSSPEGTTVRVWFRHA